MLYFTYDLIKMTLLPIRLLAIWIFIKQRAFNRDNHKSHMKVKWENKSVIAGFEYFYVYVQNIILFSIYHKFTHLNVFWLTTSVHSEDSNNNNYQNT